jgi:hypothetical protein
MNDGTPSVQEHIGSSMIRHHICHHGMKGWSVMHMDQVHQFVNDDGPDTGIWGTNQMFVQGDEARGAARTPTAAHSPNAKTLETQCVNAE